MDKFRNGRLLDGRKSKVRYYEAFLGILWRVLLASLLAAWKLGVNNYLCLNAIERIISWPSNKSFRTRHTQIPFFSFEIHGSPKMFVLTILFNLVREEVVYRND